MRSTCITRRQRGVAAVEFPLLFLLLFYIFVGALNAGFYCYACIAVQNAARTAALYTSSSSAHDTDASGACTNYVLPELQNLPNYSSFPSSCNASPLQVTAITVSAPDGTSKTVAKVTITYQGTSLIPIYGLPAQLTVSRSVQMRVRS